MEIASYHTHIYYDPDATRAIAEELRERIGERFVVRLGSWHDAKVGPHDRAMFQVSFAKDVFSSLLPWDDLVVHAEDTGGEVLVADRRLG